MKLCISTVVWGSKYVANFLDYALPSFLASGNLPELVKHIEVEYSIHTREEDVHQFQQSQLFARLVQLVPTRIGAFNIDMSMPPRNIEYHVKQPVVDAVHTAQDAVMFLAPDMIWANGSLGVVGKALAAGKIAIFLPNFKVTTETLLDDIKPHFNESGLLEIAPLVACKYLHKHMHPIVGSMFVAGTRAPAHHDYLAWPVANEGTIFYYLVRGPDCYVPHLADLTAFWSIGPSHTDMRQFVVPQCNEVIGLSMTPIADLMNFLHAGKPHNAVEHGQFMFRHQASNVGLLDPTLVPIVDQISPALWTTEIARANGYFSGVYQMRNAIIAGHIPPQPPPYLPGSYAEALTLEDCQVSTEVLQWVKAVINDRFPQATLQLLDETRDKLTRVS